MMAASKYFSVIWGFVGSRHKCHGAREVTLEVSVGPGRKSAPHRAEILCFHSRDP